MSFMGKLHEISLYGIIATIICFVRNKINISALIAVARSVNNFSDTFKCYMFWSCILFIPISIIGAFATKYMDKGEGLSFNSDNILVIIFAHIAEEILGLILSPFWFLKAYFSKELTFWSIVDFVMYAIEIIFILVGLFTMNVF